MLLLIDRLPRSIRDCVRRFDGLLLPAAVAVVMVAFRQPFDVRVSAGTAVLAVIVGFVTANGLARESGTPWLPALLTLMSLIGVWAAVPEVDHTLISGGALVGFVGLSLVSQRSAPLVPVGVLAGLVVWTALQGAVGRGWPLLGGLACAGVMLPIGLGLWNARRWWIVVGVHGVLVVIASRLVGAADEPAPGAVVLALAFGALVLVGVSRRRATSSR